MRHLTLTARLCAVAALTLLSGCAGLGPVSPTIRPSSQP